MTSHDGLRLPDAFDDLDVGITLHDGETGAILDGNDALAELYGYPVAELREMTVGDYTAPSTRFSQDAARRRIEAAAAGDPQVFEWQIERANGELRWVRVHLNSSTVDGHECVIAEIEDITEYRTRERRLRLLSRIVRHNLRNKMNVIMAYSDRVKRAIEDETLEDGLETVLNITEEVGRLSESVQQIEEIAEPDATERVPTDLQDVVLPVIDRVRAGHDDVELSVGTMEEVTVIADKGINYAFEHALENAIEHNDQETAEVAVSIGAAESRDRGLIRVADNGPTIPETEIAVLEEDVEKSSTFHGSGVGLWVMQWCVDSLGGDLTFEENSPRGNVVTFSLPKADEPARE